MTHGIKSLTVLVGCVLHSVGPIAFVGDVGVRVGAWWIGDAGVDVAATTLVVSPSVHCEMGGHFPQNACREETNKENQTSESEENFWISKQKQSRFWVSDITFTNIIITPNKQGVSLESC